MSLQSADKRGFLTDNFRLFHLKDRHTKPIDFHYHEFLKVVIFLSGNASYNIEGKSYQLKPYDVLFINYHEIHRPVILDTEPYERIILWIGREFLNQNALIKDDLSQCFFMSAKTGSHLLRFSNMQQGNLKNLLFELESSLTSSEFANELLSNLLFLQLMILFNRMCLKESRNEVSNSYAVSNPVVDQLIAYITDHIAEDLSIDALSQQFFLSSSYLMHKFKEVTGSSLHNYITQKRIFSALELMRNGESITTAALMSGFKEYTTFLRTFRRLYHCTPSDYVKRNVTGLPKERILPRE